MYTYTYIDADCKAPAEKIYKTYRGKQRHKKKRTDPYRDAYLATWIHNTWIHHPTNPTYYYR